MTDPDDGRDRISLVKPQPDPSVWTPAPPTPTAPPTEPYPAPAPDEQLGSWEQAPSWEQSQPWQQAQPGQPYPGLHQPAQPYAGPSYPAGGYPGPGGYGLDPMAPYGRDPLTGQPLSDKSKIVAGLLQFFLGWLGVGRFYMGSTAIGVCQLVLFLAAFVTFFFIIGVFLWLGLAFWTFIDAIVILVGSPRDDQGRLLRS